MLNNKKYIFHYDTSRPSTIPAADKRYRKYDGQECTTSSVIDNAYADMSTVQRELVAAIFEDGYKCNVYVSELEEVSYDRLGT